MKIKNVYDIIFSMDNLYEMTLEQVAQTFNSYTGMLEHTDSEELLASLYTDMILTHGERRENEERFIQMLPQEEEMLYGI